MPGPTELPRIGCGRRVGIVAAGAKTVCQGGVSAIVARKACVWTGQRTFDRRIVQQDVLLQIHAANDFYGDATSHRFSSHDVAVHEPERQASLDPAGREGGEPLTIVCEITAADIEKIGEGLWELKVTNFDRNNRSACVLDVRYDLGP